MVQPMSASLMTVLLASWISGADSGVTFDFEFDHHAGVGVVLDDRVAVQRVEALHFEGLAVLARLGQHDRLRLVGPAEELRLLLRQERHVEERVQIRGLLRLLEAHGYRLDTVNDELQRRRLLVFVAVDDPVRLDVPVLLEEGNELLPPLVFLSFTISLPPFQFGFLPFLNLLFNNSTN
jgi:hypothetical protein